MYPAWCTLRFLNLWFGAYLHFGKFSAIIISDWVLNPASAITREVILSELFNLSEP